MEPQPGNTTATAPPVVLKKYGNRRLYDTSASRYVTLVEVEAMVQGGKDVLVIDAKTGEDLTKEVMVQLILERDGARAALPTSLLKQAVRMANSPLKEGLVRAMQEGLDGFLVGQRAVVDAQRTLMAQMGQLTPWVSPAAVPAAMWNPYPVSGPGAGAGLTAAGHGLSQAQHSAAAVPSQAQQQAHQQAQQQAHQQAQQHQNTTDLGVLKAELVETQALVRRLLEREAKHTEKQTEKPAKTAKAAAKPATATKAMKPTTKAAKAAPKSKKPRKG